MIKWIAFAACFAIGPLSFAQASSNFRIAVDSQSFLKDESGQHWKRVSAARASEDSEHVFIEVLAECSGKRVFVDQIRFVLVHKSKQSPGAPAPFVKGDYKSQVEDWQQWRGRTALRVSSKAGASRELEVPIHDATDLLLPVESGANATALRLNPGPGRPRSVEALLGGARAVSGIAVENLSKALGLDGAQQFSLAYISQSGTPGEYSFDLTGLERSLALALNSHCGSP